MSLKTKEVAETTCSKLGRKLGKWIICEIPRLRHSVKLILREGGGAGIHSSKLRRGTKYERNSRFRGKDVVFEGLFMGQQPAEDTIVRPSRVTHAQALAATFQSGTLPLVASVCR